MTRRFALIAALAMAQPVAAKPAAVDYPDTVSFGKSAKGLVHTASDRRTLYRLSHVTVRSRSGVVAAYCSGPCLQVWTPYSPKADAKPVGDWTIIDGVQGKQWACGRDPVYTFNADHKPGERKGDGYEDMWVAIPYVPPKPSVIAPATVEARLVDQAWLLSDIQGHALILAGGKSPCDCTPFAAGMASLPIGDWTVLRNADAPQWAWRGKPVFVSDTADAIPAKAKVLRP
ncbi:MAG: hypothetical protein RL367_1428 [Pseudomonadota bacterium]